MSDKINKCGCGGVAKKHINGYIGQIICEKCGSQTQSIDIAREDIIYIWNTAHPEQKEEPTISNAMQAVKWLEEGEDIQDIETKERFTLSNGFIVLFNNTAVSLSVGSLLVRKWKLYEEPKSYKEQLEDLLSSNDAERNHLEADEILLKILEEAGHSDIVELYNKIEKYYA